jgi:hypothetical protein
MHEDFDQMFGVPVNIDSKPMMMPEKLPLEEVDVDWIISETNEYGSWTDRNPL